MSSEGPSKGKTKLSRTMDCLKNYNTSLPRLSDSSRSGAKSSHSRPSQRSKTMTSSRRQFSDDNSPERRPSRTQSLDEYHSSYYGNRSVPSVPRASASQKRDHSRSRDFSRSSRRREREVRPRELA